ncbi:MAG TPA: LysM peptidoglycan-binding domain-containing protein [Streptosporangiaceae bacterium]|jgi:LysM repeat protein
MIVRKVVASATVIAAATIGGQAAASAATTSTAHATARHAEANQARTYTVQPGDTLSGIAARFGISWKSLYAKNKKAIGSNPDLIFAGQVLKLPAGAAAVPAQQAPVSSTPQQSQPVTGSGSQSASSSSGSQSASSPSGSQSASSSSSGQQASSQQSASSGGGQVSTTGQSAFEKCVSWRESGNTPTDPDGLYGFLPSTWHQLGYSGSAGQASAATQHAAFQKAYSMWGTSPWAPYDGC